MSKQVKAALRAAKQSIQNKEYKDALKHCEEIFKHDEKNYNGLVFYGLCLAELCRKEDSRSAYHDAIAAQPDQILAYQGLVNLYTKHWVAKLTEENTNDLISTYQALIRLTNEKEEKKLFDFYVKLSGAYSSIGKIDDSMKALSNAFLKAGSDGVSRDVIYSEVVECVKIAKPPYSDVQAHLNLVFDAVSHICVQATSSIHSKEDALLHLIICLQNDQRLLREKLGYIIPTSLSFCESQEKSDLGFLILTEIFVQDAKLFDETSLKKYHTLQENYDGTHQNLIKGHQSYHNGDYDTCVELFENCLHDSGEFIPARLLLCEAYTRMHKHSTAETKARRSLHICKTLQTSAVSRNSSWLVRLASISDLKLDLTLCLADALAESGDESSVKLAVATYEKLSKVRPESMEIFLGLAKSSMKLDDLTSACSYLDQVDKVDPDNISSKCWRAYIDFMLGEKNKSISSLEELVDADPSSFLAHFLLGKLMWESDPIYRRDKKKCFSFFLKAAKLDVYHGETFLYLGHFYRDVANDRARAVKCYEKAHSLDGQSEAIGAALADQFIVGGDYEAAIKLYENITNVAAAGTCKWAWLRLGLCRLKTSDSSSAIKCFQAALRADVNDYICWECLGEGYLSRGSFSAAWKAFSRAHELEPSSVYSIYQMAAIKQILCQYPEAISEYTDVLKISPNYVPALKGLGESHLSMAKFMLTEGRDLTCVDHINEAIQNLASALQTRGQMCCVWKLLGDSCSITRPLHSSCVKILMPKMLSSLQNKDHMDDDVVVLSKMQALEAGEKFYAQALHLHNDASLWHDLALNCFWQSNEEEYKSKQLALANKSLLVLQKAITIENDNHKFWNSLGVVSASENIQNYELAQHSYLKSINLEPNNVEAWSNLGNLYLDQSQIELAHKAFKTAQSLDPSYVNSWVGQALIAESIGSEEAMDLFRHSTELGLHSQASIGYAMWICNTISDSENMSASKLKENIQEVNAVAAAVTQMSKYCSRHPHHAWAFSLYGFVLEQSSLLQSSEKAYKHALDAYQLRCESSVDENDKLNLKKMIVQAKSDYARLLRKTGKFSESIEAYRSISPLNKFCDVYGLAISLFRGGKLNEAFTALEQAKLIAPNDDDRIEVMVAMAILLWRQKKKKEARELLESCGNHKIKVVQCLCAFGILQNDNALVESTLQDLIAYDVNNKKQSDVTIDNCLFIAAGMMLQNPSKARVSIQKYIHRYPNEWRFRDILSQLLCSNNSSMACTSAHQSKKNFNQDDVISSQDGKKCRKDHQRMSLTHSTTALANGDHRSRSADPFKTCQRFLHSHPYSTKALALLGASCHAHSVLSSFTTDRAVLLPTTQSLANLLAQNSDGKLHAWAVKLNMLSCLVEHKHEVVEDLAKKISVDFEESDVIGLLSECDKQFQATGAIDDVTKCEVGNIARSKSATKLTKQLIAHIFDCDGSTDEAVAQIQDELKLSDERGTSVALKSAHLAYQAARRGGDGVDTWCAKAREYINEAIRVSGDLPLVQLMDGLCHRLAASSRKTKSALNKVLNNPTSGNSLCTCKNIAAWYLYMLHHDKNDHQQMTKLLEKWSTLNDSDYYISKIKNLLPLENMT
ncbi:superkiller complex protein 3-like [Clavelina lepadiformis]|uniref:superkiller complex protein 3-like n=1 Tax=Clavelina lepadiformis TaxID=159417 RepID=UPI0040433BB6